MPSREYMLAVLTDSLTRPCPLCAAPADTFSGPEGKGMRCTECTCQVSGFETFDEAVRRWNHRPIRAYPRERKMVPCTLFGKPYMHCRECDVKYPDEGQDKCECCGAPAERG